MDLCPFYQRLWKLQNFFFKKFVPAFRSGHPLPKRPTHESDCLGLLGLGPDWHGGRALAKLDAMKTWLAASLILSLQAVCAPTMPLALAPENPHYFEFRGKPLVVISSGEHYGAVLNRDFEFVKYLDTLARDGLNGTRTWAGAYCEPADAFKIADNTLAPLPGKLLCPWARSTQPGYVNGGNKFDLSQWDRAYFKRLRSFVKEAGRRGIIVELNLFCPFYEEGMWELSPMNARNNINGIGAVARTDVYTLDKSGALLAVQEAMVRKIVSELKGYDNLYYEICNEPYFGGVTLEWQRHIATVISQTEAGWKGHHLISQNIANDKAKVDQPDPAVSILNFHYATPPEAVGLNYGLARVVGENETGFRGTNDAQYRMEGWDFIVGGGGLFNNLDYSFTAGREDGTFVYPETQPGGGSLALRRQYGFLRRVVESFDYVHMRPEAHALEAELPPGATARALVKTGRDYLVYIRTGLGEEWKQRSRQRTSFKAGELTLRLDLPAGQFVADWLDPKQGSSIRRDLITHAGGAATLVAPAFEDDIALAVRKD